MKHFLLLCFTLCLFTFSQAQTAEYCPYVKTIVGFDSPADVPTVADNGDGTITLTHSEQYITDIFANYTIYSFTEYIVSQNITSYVIGYETRDLINDLYANTPVGTFTFEDYATPNGPNYSHTPIDPLVISLLDGASFTLNRTCATSDDFTPNNCLDDLTYDGFEFDVQFNYDANSDILYMETTGLTPCGNAFQIGFKGADAMDGVTELQVWSSSNITIGAPDFSSPCNTPEETILSIFDMSCDFSCIDFIKPQFDLENGLLSFRRENLIFGHHLAVFEGAFMNLDKIQPLAEYTFFKSKHSPYLQSKQGTTPQTLFLELYSISGELLIKKTSFETDKITLDAYASGLYLLKVSDALGQSRTQKLLIP